MPKPLTDWIAEQQGAMTANWKIWHVPPAIAIEGTHVLGPNYGGPEGRATSWLPLPGVDRAKAVIQKTGVVTSLWVCPSDDDYVKMYRWFLTEFCHVAADKLTHDHDVDHMYNRQRAINFRYGYVRLFPAAKGANRSHGAGYEKAMTASDLGRHRKVMKLLDEVSTMKFFGVASPSIRREASAAQRSHARAMANQFDLTVEQIEAGRDSLMSRAYRQTLP